MNAYLRKNNIEFYTFSVRSEKQLKVVLKHIPQAIEEKEVWEDMEHSNYKIQEVRRMKVRNRPLPMVLIDIGKQY